MYPIVERIASIKDLEAGSLFGAALVDVSAELTAAQIQAYLKSSARGYDDLYVSFLKSDTVDADEATNLLNAGASAIVVTPARLEALVSAGIPSERLIVAAAEPAQAAASGQGVYLESGDLRAVANAAADFSLKNHTALAPVLFSGAAEGEIPDQVSQVLAGDAILPALKTLVKSDRHDGLWSTVVTNESHEVLGVCFSSYESLCEALRTRTGVYQSRRRGLWYKGESSGATQALLRVRFDCDSDALEFVVEQKAPGFCHNNIQSCFGPARGLTKLTQTVQSRLANAPAGSYTARLVSEPGLLEAKIKEEADELTEAQTSEEVAFEAADLLYFMSVKLAKHNLTFADVEANLDAKSRKITRRPGNAKPKYVETKSEQKPAAPAAALAAAPAASADASKDIHMHVLDASSPDLDKALQRPAQSSNAFELARPIVDDVRKRGDTALLEYTAKFEKATDLKSPVLNAPFPPELMQLPQELKDAIDLAYANVSKFHSAQLLEPLQVETSKGVVCSRFSRPIERVGLYVPGGTAILPSTTIMLGVPAQVAGCKHIAVATPPRSDGTASPEVVYVAHKIGAAQIVLAGGAQAVSALAYGTASVPKVDKILGPGNQFVTAAKMIVSTDLAARVSIDMPAGPSEVLVVADSKASKKYVAADLLSQAEHGADSQVVLVSVAWTDADVAELQTELDKQAKALPRVEIIRKSIGHSTIVRTSNYEEAIALSNRYAPEHLILQCEDASKLVPLVTNAGSVFVGAFSPESCGDYTSGTNHTLPTYGYAQQYSGVNTDTYLKYITAQELTAEGLQNIGPATVALARREGLDAHANAVVVRLE